VGVAELDQQAVEVPPFLINDLLNRLWEGVKRVDADTLKDFGFDGLERGADPLYARPSLQKLQIFEFCGLREVKQKRTRRGYVCKRR